MMSQSSAPAKDPRAAHAREIVSHGGVRDRSFQNSLITLYSDQNLSSYSLRVFSQIKSPNVVSWTALIHAHSGDPISLRHFVSMLRHPTPPNHRTVTSLFKTCALLSALPFGLALHSLSLKLSLADSPFSGSAIVSFYSKLRRPADARQAFDEIPLKDEVCYSAVVVALARNACPSEALSAYAEMVRGGFRSTMFSLSAALSAAAELAALERCRILHSRAITVGFDCNPVVGSAVVDCYGKSGMVGDARRVFDENADAMNAVGFNAMMSGYAQQGDTRSTVELFASMQARSLVPDNYTFLAVLSSFCNAGADREAERWLASMRSDFGLDPGLEHYTCLVGALARSGRVSEAHLVVKSMPFEPDAAVWRALMSAAAARGDADLARAFAGKLLEVDPGDDTAYVILANVLAGSGRWDEVAEVRKEMKERRVCKEIGRSWIEVGGHVHAFWAGDRSHVLTVEIYRKASDLMEEIGRLGYVPVWAEAPRDVGEVEKRRALWGHSEKLALAFAVLRGVPKGKAVRIVKNLRICSDCHRAFEFLSALLEREIIVRDKNRYHRFWDGVCNCGGVW